jgi:hypothetical protein
MTKQQNTTKPALVSHTTMVFRSTRQASSKEMEGRIRPGGMRKSGKYLRNIL